MHTQTNDPGSRPRVTTQGQIFAIVRDELVRVRRAQTPDFAVEIGMDSCLVTDVGLDSLSLVEAVVALEQALGIEHLSIETLNERGTACHGGRFTVSALVELCMEQAAA
jgi:acyl carrier protein